MGVGVRGAVNEAGGWTASCWVRLYALKGSLILGAISNEEGICVCGANFGGILFLFVKG